ncbi:MAG: uncharacterized membrane protein YbhN (UPF0104 family) [Acidimicrobiales bacterium]|jgi:uncharacterized membrane protein YbhN (UPF0104 family)
MNVVLRLLRRVPADRFVVVGGLVALLATSFAVVGLVTTLDFEDLQELLAAARSDPLGLSLALGSFGLAFFLRAILWSRLVPAISFAQAAAALHVALGANHVLPFRLGEPLRVVSAVRRSSVAPSDALLTGALLRLSDVIALLGIGLVLGPAVIVRLLGPFGIALLAGLAVVLLLLGRMTFARAKDRSDLRAPDVLTGAGALAAWGLEAMMVWVVAGWADIDLSYSEAVLVTAVAVSAQLVAIAPGGLGTYEAAASTAMVLVGVPVVEALSVAVAAHLLKTLYSLTAGVIALFVPCPSLIGRLRLPKSIAPAERTEVGEGPVVLFLPAYDEEPRIAAVISRAPAYSLGRPLHLLVIDDGSTDGTAETASSAGATVVAMERNTGLGAAVARGFREAVERFDASVVVFCDADGEYDPAEIDLLVAPILDGHSDYVVGSRFAGNIEHMRPHRRLGNAALTRWVRWMTNRDVTDGQSGYRALSRQAALAVEMAHDYNYAQVLTLDLLAKGYRYSEVPITYRFRESGASFVNLGRYLRTVVPAVWGVLNRQGRTALEEDATAVSADQ